MALSGLSTRTVLTAEKLTFCRLSEYSSILKHTERMEACVNRAAANAVAVSAGRARWRWELKQKNGKTLLCSQLYFACIKHFPPLTGQVVINHRKVLNHIYILAFRHGCNACVLANNMLSFQRSVDCNWKSRKVWKTHTCLHTDTETRTHKCCACLCLHMEQSIHAMFASLTNTRLYLHVPSHNQPSKQRVAYAHPLWDVKSGWITHHWMEDMASTVHKRAASDQSAS